MQTIEEHVHHLYWDYDINCARTMLMYLARYFKIPLNDQTLQAAIGMHGGGGFGAQCGLVEGALMFLGIYGARKDCRMHRSAGSALRMPRRSPLRSHRLSAVFYVQRGFRNPILPTCVKA